MDAKHIVMDLDTYLQMMNPSALKKSGQEVMDNATYLAGFSLTEMIKERITERGMGTNKPLPGYSEKPYRFNEKAFFDKSKFKPKKKGQKTMYIDTGYSGLRNVQGRQSNMKNLVYSGHMMDNWGIGKRRRSYVIGFGGSRDFQGKTAAEKKRYLESQEDMQIFEASESERVELTKEIYKYAAEFSPLKLIR